MEGNCVNFQVSTSRLLRGAAQPVEPIALKSQMKRVLSSIFQKRPTCCVRTDDGILIQYKPSGRATGTRASLTICRLDFLSISSLNSDSDHIL